jgi:hypothetical protein
LRHAKGATPSADPPAPNGNSKAQCVHGGWHGHAAGHCHVLTAGECGSSLPALPQLHPCIHHAVGPQVCIVTDVTSPSDADDGPHVRSMQARARWVELAAERYRPKRPLQQRYRMPGRALSVICCWLTATPCACTHPHAANPLSATNLCQIQRGMLSMQLPVRLHVSLCLKLRCLHLGVTALVKHASTPTDNTHAAMPAAGH